MVGTRILGGSTAPFPPFLNPNRVPHGSCPKILVLAYLVVEQRILELMQQAAQAAEVRGRMRRGRGLRDGGVVFSQHHSRVEAVGVLELLRGRQQARAVCEGMVASVPGTWGKAMRGAVRNKERWKRRRAPAQDPSTDLAGHTPAGHAGHTPGTRQARAGKRVLFRAPTPD